MTQVRYCSGEIAVGQVLSQIPPTAEGVSLSHAVFFVSTCKRICQDAQRAGLSPAAGRGAA